MDIALVMLLVLALGLAAFVWWLVVLIEALRTPRQQWEAAGQSQLVSVLLMVLAGLLGTVVYVAVARPQLRSAHP